MSMQIELAQMEPSQIDEAARTAVMRFYSGAAVDRFDWWTGESYKLRFEVTDKACDLGRLKTGAPLLMVHDSYDLESVAGVILDGWIQDGQAFAKAKFSDREEVAPIWADVKNGILRHVSMGVSIRQSQRIEKDGRLLEITALEWEPQEISIVPVPADPGASFLSINRGQPPQWLAQLMSSRAGASSNEKPESPALAFAARMLKGSK